MKKNRLNLFAVIALVFLIAGCKKETAQQDPTGDNPGKATGNYSQLSREPEMLGACNSSAYFIVLESRSFIDGNWEWIWSVQNSNPGNGNNGTIQDLSHWGMQFGSCFVMSAVVSGAFSGDGITWTGFTPSFERDPSQTCMTSPVLKFDYGTTGNAKSYYKLVLNQEYQPTEVPGYYKSGRNTGCCTFNFNGIGCGGGPVVK
ncbi:MAG: hypothetical protein IPI68_02155 [Chitinophagaceae bacterium]|nr:hypothetical protein [Chitinophagaceae bacterium]